jgi:hypothetical protein
MALLYASPNYGAAFMHAATADVETAPGLAPEATQAVASSSARRCVPRAASLGGRTILSTAELINRAVKKSERCHDGVPK